VAAAAMSLCSFPEIKLSPGLTAGAFFLAYRDFLLDLIKSVDKLGVAP
jgi:hypothetical protein